MADAHAQDPYVPAPPGPDAPSSGGPPQGHPAVSAVPALEIPRAPMAPASAASAPPTSPPVTFVEYTAALDRKVQRGLDVLAPHQLYRWLGLVTLLGIFMLRMFLIHGFYIVTYVLGIFILNQFILFLQPKDRASLIARRADAQTPSSPSAQATDPSALPSLDAEEFRPFVRRLPEFQMWHSVTLATLASIVATFIPLFDVPVFWPVLVFYFILLFVATMRRQWLDMKRLKYVPWDIGAKKTYKSDPKTLSVKPRDAASVARAKMDGSGAAGSSSPPPPVPTVKRVPGMKQSVS